ncbi:MAG TPA: nuclear transport factor 2 family protein [Chthoniobacterales bacterium]|nr:nuclear transport factor 2 family protein [Chthoniobacterales bacterium]
MGKKTLIFWLTLATAITASGTVTPNDPKSVVDRFLTAYRATDVEEMMKLLSPNIVFDDPTTRLHAEGHDGLRKMVEPLRASYRNVTIDIHNMLVHGDHVAVEVTIAGLVTRKDGSTRNIKVRGASFFRVKNGLIETWTDYYDAQTFREQLA